LHLDVRYQLFLGTLEITERECLSGAMLECRRAFFLASADSQKSGANKTFSQKYFKTQFSEIDPRIAKQWQAGDLGGTGQYDEFNE
jgi:hypothetical protein